MESKDEAKPRRLVPRVGSEWAVDGQYICMLALQPELDGVDMDAVPLDTTPDFWRKSTSPMDRMRRMAP